MNAHADLPGADPSAVSYGNCLIDTRFDPSGVRLSFGTELVETLHRSLVNALVEVSVDVENGSGALHNAAHRLAQHALTNNDPAEATWAARKGLAATGACEQCYRNLMRAAAAEGNQVAFEAVYSELLAVVDADEGPDASSLLDPDTIELYEQESRRRRRRRAG